MQNIWIALAIILMIIIMPFIIYVVARIGSLGIFRSFFEIKNHFNNLNKEGNNVSERQTEKKEG